MHTLRASELGRCVKASAAILQGFAPLPTPEKVQGYYDAGNDHETANAAALREQGWLITGEQHEVSLQFPGAVVEGHLDGILTPGVGMGLMAARIWESKSPGAYKKFEQAYKTNVWTDPLTHRYAWQASVYMLAKQMEMMVTCLDGDQIRSFVIEVPPFTVEQVEQRVGEILDSASGELPVLCSQNDYPCPVAYLHEDPEFDDDPAIDVLVGKYLEAGRVLKETKEDQDRIKKEIEAALGDRDTVSTAASKVTRYVQKGATKWDDTDVESFLLSHGREPDDFKVTGKASQRLKITGRDGE